MSLGDKYKAGTIKKSFPATVALSAKDISFITGPLALGCMTSYLFYGAFVVQLFFYHIHYPTDHRCIRAIVWLVFVLETLLTALTGIIAWNIFGEGVLNPINLLFHVPDSWKVLPFVNASITALVQNFFSWKLWKLTQRPWIPTIISLTSLLGCTLAFIFNIKMITSTTDTYFSPFTVYPLVSAWLACNALCDVLVTGATVIMLVKFSADAVGTTTIISHLIKFTLETGLITAIWATFELILWLTMPHNSFHYIFFFGLGPLYSNWLLTTLNSRVYISGSTSRSLLLHEDGEGRLRNEKDTVMSLPSPLGMD